MTINLGDSASSLANIQLNKSNQAISDVLERIASGHRINKAADDAASLTIANELDGQLRGIGQSLRNANDDIAMYQIADGALGEVSNIMMDIREKAVMSVNASHSAESRNALQSEISGALSSIDNIVKSTSYNGKALLDNSFLSATEHSANLSDIDLTTPEGAEMALGIIDEVAQNVGSQMSDFGSRQNQASSEINNLRNAFVNTASARSTIMDTDLAEEIMSLRQAESLRETGVFALAQMGKMNKASMMELLQG